MRSQKIAHFGRQFYHVGRGIAHDFDRNICINIFIECSECDDFVWRVVNAMGVFACVEEKE